MLPHEEFLKKALEECKISKLVHDLGSLYSSLCLSESDDDFRKALKVDKILKKAAMDIADLGAKPLIKHPLDGRAK